MANTFHPRRVTVNYLTDLLALQTGYSNSSRHSQRDNNKSDNFLTRAGGRNGEPQSHVLDFRTVSLQAAALLLPAWLQRQSLDRARDGLGVSVPGALVEVFFECKVLHSCLGSLLCPVPGCRGRLLALPRDARRGTAVSAVTANSSESYLGGRGAGREGKYCP